MSESEHTVVEADLARELGLSKEAIRELRKQHLLAGEFELGRTGTCLTPAAADRLRLACGSPEKKEAENFEKKGGPDLAGDLRPVVTLYVKRCPVNRKIVEACLKADLTGDVVRVRVNTNVNFIPRMEMKARREAWSMYVLVGRCPRYRGRY